METPVKDGKSLPTLTPKNSAGSQRVIKQIMVIDPNKLRVAGLDLKMAEALKKSKGRTGNTHSNRTKDDKLALAKTLLNRKLKQAKSSKDAQNQNVMKETCDSPQKLQGSVAALQSLLSQPRTYITPSPKKPHTMLVNILENDQRTGSIELTISNASHRKEQQERQVVEPIPKASIKMTKPVTAKDGTPKVIESMVISPEVKFEVKRKSLPSNTCRASTDPQSSLPQVIESKVLTAEEKIDMKSLCGSSTMPVPAKVKIEITKQEILHRVPPAQAIAVPANEKLKETVSIPVIAKQGVLQQTPSPRVNVVSAKVTPEKCVIVQETTNQQMLHKIQVKAACVREQPKECLELKVSSPKHILKKTSEVSLPAAKEESAVDFITSLLTNTTAKPETKSTTVQKVEPSVESQEDATSFLMSLFGQQPFTPTLLPEVPKVDEAKVVAAVEQPVPRDEPVKQESKAKPEKEPIPQGHRRIRKPVPIIKPRPRVPGAAKVAKPSHVPEVVSEDATSVSKEVSESSVKVTSIELEAGCDEKPAVGSENREITETRETRDKESLAGLSLTIEVKNSMEESKSKSEDIPNLEEKHHSDWSTNQRSTSINKQLPLSVNDRSISAKTEEAVRTYAECDDKLTSKRQDEDSMKKAILKDVQPEAGVAAVAAVSVPLEVVQTNVDKVTPKKKSPLKNAKSMLADKVVQDVKQSSSKVEENSATKTVDSTETVESAQKAEVGDEKCDSPGAFSKSDILATADSSEIHKGDAPAENKIVPSALPVECSKPEIIQQMPVQVDDKKTDPVTENVQPKVEAVPPAPQPTGRRKSKKSVPILIAKLGRNRKPAGTQEKPKQTETQVAPTADQAKCTSDKGVEEKIEVKDGAATSQTQVKTMGQKVPPNKADKAEQVDEKLDHTPETVSRQSQPEEVSTQGPTSNQVTTVSAGIVDAKEKPISSGDIVTSSQSETPCSKDGLQKPREETVQSDSRVVTKEVSVASTEEPDQEPRKEVVNESPTKVIEPPREQKQLTSPKKLNRAKMSAAAVHELNSPEKSKGPVTQLETEARGKPTCSAKTVASRESEAGRAIITKETSVSSTEEIGQEPREEIVTELPTEPTEQAKQSPRKEKGLLSPNKARKGTPSATGNHEFKSLEKTKADVRQKEDKSATDVTGEKDGISNTVLWTEAKTRRYSRVRKKCPDPKEHVGAASDLATTDPEKSDEAVSDIESPKIESPIPQEALTSKETECAPQEVTKPLACDFTAMNQYDVIQKKLVWKNDTISLPTTIVDDDDDDSSAELVIDEDYHCDSDFMELPPDDTDIRVTSHVERRSSQASAIDFDSLKSADKSPCEKVTKSLYESKEDLDFLGFDEQEIEEGHQSTTLRLSQSEDISALKSLSHSEMGNKKKGVHQFKKIPLSVAKKQKAEQKNWKKNSAKSLQNWLKSSDKDTSVKEEDTSLVETKNDDKMSEAPAEGKELVSDCKQASPNRAMPEPVENKLSSQASTPVRGRKKKGKQDEAGAEKKTKPEKSSSKRKLKTEKEVKGLSESVSNIEHVEKKAEPEKSSLKQDSKTEKELKGLNESVTGTKTEKQVKELNETGTITEHAEKKTEPEMSSSKGSSQTEKEVTDVKECVAITVHAEKKTEPEMEKEVKKVKGSVSNQPENQSNTPAPTCLAQSKTGHKSSARGRKKKIKKGEEDACPTESEPKSSSKSTKNTTLDDHFPKAENESVEIKSPSESKVPGQEKKPEACAIEVSTDPLPTQTTEPCSNTAKRKLEMDSEESKTATPVPPKKRKYVRKSLKEPSTPAATEPTQTPKSGRGVKAKRKSMQLDVSQSVEADGVTPSPIEPNARKRKAPKSETETPNKVAHISADTDFEFSTPTPKKRGPKKLELSDTPGIVITPQSERKYKNSMEFNPRLLLIRTKEEYKSDAPLVDPSLQTVPKSKDDVQCALCMGYTPKKKWLQHVSEHYGVGWLVGSKPPLNITCRSAVLNYMVEFFKTSKVKGLNCRICNVLRRSALGLLSHIEQCCLTEEELKDSRITCEHCKKDYSKSSLPSHLRTCPEIWKKPKPEPVEEVNEKEVALSNTGRLKRKSVIKAEHKFKDMDSADISPDEFIKHVPQPRKDYCVAAWQRDIKSFGKGFCTEKKCEFTAATVEELEKHCQEGVCAHFVPPGYFCMKCKFHSDNMETTRKHVLEKHITKPSEDFQASEDDAVISQESSSEDGSSGDEEASEKSTADLEASAKRKPKKKSNSTRSRAQSSTRRSIPVKDIRKLIPLATSMPSEVARLHQEFINLNYSESALFSYAAPKATPILDDDTEPYFSKSSLSPKFALNGFQVPFVNAFGQSRVQPDQWQQLQRLNGMGTATEHVMYLGGPVKAIAWVPLMPHTTSEFQYLASVTRKDANKFARFVQPKQSRTLVCIHRYQLTGTEPEQISGEIYYALAVEDGPIHCIEFLPSGGYDPEMNRLGLLAVGTAKSEVKVYSLPLNVQKRDCDMFPILRIEPSFVLALELDERDPSDYYTSQCSSLSWSQFAGHSHIVGGYINGFVSIWDISDDDDNISRFLVNGVRKFVPVSYFWSKESRIREVASHYDMNGLRWLGVCNAARNLVFFDIRDITNPVQILDERAKNECNAIDWPVVWSHPAYGLGDAMPTHGCCLSVISPAALGYVNKKIERFCSGVTDLHFNPWTNMYAAGSENGDLQVTPLRDTIIDVSCRRKKEEKIIASLDIVPLDGGELNESMPQSAHVFETDYTEKYGILFGSAQEITSVKLPELYSPKRVPPLILSRLSRIHQVRFNHNQKNNTFLAVGYVNGLLRVLMDKWKDPVYTMKPTQMTGTKEKPLS